MQTQKVIKTPGEIAGEWWAEVLAHPEFDNGDQSFIGAMTQAMASTSVKEKSPEDLKRFGELIAKAVDEGLKAEGEVVLRVDYNPCKILADAAKVAGLYKSGDVAIFPWKTTMWVERRKVAVRYGYGAQIETIWEERFDEQ